MKIVKALLGSVIDALVSYRVDIASLTTRTERLEKQMSDLTTAEQGVEASETALEARVNAHEANDAATSAALQAQIDALKAGGDTSAVTASLVALKQRIDNFDPDTAPAPTA